MWHEARRQEKLVRSKMVDSVKRHERRKVFYESIRRDPEEFMQIHGRRATIHMDASVAAAAEGTNILRKWQGDPDVLIDRFDVRAHLDYIPEFTERTNPSAKQLLLDDAQELQCEYERYRILIFNEYLKVPERSCLNQIASKEFWPSMTTGNIHKIEMENKKKAAEKKAAIGFTYADSTAPSARGDASNSGNGTNKANTANSESDSDSSDDVEIDDMDMKFDVEEITPEQGAILNKIGNRYRIGGSVFLKLMRLDYKEQDNNAQIKEIDKAKLALSGRQAKADRAALKRRRAMIVGKVTQNEEATTTLLSFLANAKKNAGDSLALSSSESDSDDEEKTEFITSIGGEDDDSDREHRPSFSAAAGNGSTSSDGKRVYDDEYGVSRGVVQGPVLPTKEYRRLWELKRRRSNSIEEFKDPFGTTTKRRRSQSRSRSRSYERPRRDDRSNRRRQTSNNHSSANSSSARSRYAPDRSNRSGFSRRSWSRSSSRSYDRKRESERRMHQRSDRRHSRRSSSLSSNSSHNPSPVHASRESPIISNDGNTSGSDSPLTIRSSMSESEKEQLEIENRKRRIRRIKRDVKNQSKSSANKAEEDRKRTEEADHQKAGLAKKLRHQMQKTLKKTAEQLKQEEEEKAREQFKERKQREEELLEEARILRIREREKLRQEDEKAAASRERDRLQRRAEREAAEKASRSRRHEETRSRGRDSSRRRRRSSS